MGFIFFTIAMMWMWAGQINIITLTESTLGRADLAISEGTTYVFLTNEAMSFWTQWTIYAKLALNGMFVFVWVSFFYATFIYKWDQHDAPRPL